MGSRVIIPDEAEVNFCSHFFNTIDFSSINWHLFKNNLIVSDTTVLTDLTEADYTSYAAQLVELTTPTEADSWADVPGNKGTFANNLVTFPANTGSDQTVYGVYATYTTALGADTMLFVSNCFDAQGAPSLSGRNMAGGGLSLTLALNLRLWDYTQDQEGVPTFQLTGIPDPYSTLAPFDVTVTALNRDRTTNVFYSGTMLIFANDPGGTGYAASGLTAGVGTFTIQLLSGFSEVAIIAIDLADPKLIGGALTHS